MCMCFWDFLGLYVYSLFRLRLYLAFAVTGELRIIMVLVKLQQRKLELALKIIFTLIMMVRDLDNTHTHNVDNI